jgi:hypothetical protein
MKWLKKLWRQWKCSHEFEPLYHLVENRRGVALKEKSVKNYPTWRCWKCGKMEFD